MLWKGDQQLTEGGVYANGAESVSRNGRGLRISHSIETANAYSKTLLLITGD